MSDLNRELPPIDFPFERGLVRGCGVCMQNKPTHTVSTFKDAKSGEWLSVCDECSSKGA